MDVICDRCKAEYEFDEALLGDKGTTVKCSACGHVFRVLPPNRDAGRSQLKLRFSRDGTVKSLGSLRELQQRIRAGEVSLDDELGRDGFPFRLLRDVPELKNFFMSAPPPDMSKQRERPTARPEASRAGQLPDAPTRTHTAPPAPRRSAFATDPRSRAEEPRATAARDAAATAVPTGETLLGSAPSVRAPLGASDTTREPEPRAASQRPPAATAQPIAAAPTSPESRSRSFSKHTMMGVGPDDLALPRPPRVPQFGGSAADANTGRAAHSADAEARAATGGPGRPLATSPARERTQPATSDKTLHGMPIAAPFGGGNGTTPGPIARPASAAPPASKPSVRPASASMDRGGTLPAVSAAAARAVAAAPPQRYAGSAPAAHGADASAASAAGAGYAGGGGDESGHELHSEPAAGRGVAPFDLASSAFPQVEGEVERLPNLNQVGRDGPSEPAPKLYLDDEDSPPERATEPSSRLWLYVVLLLLIGGGTYLASSKLNLLNLLERLTGEPAPALAPGPSAVADPALADAAMAESTADAGEVGSATADGYPAPAFAPPVTTGEPGAESTGATEDGVGASPSAPSAAAPAKAVKPGKTGAEPVSPRAGRDKRPADAPALAIGQQPADEKPASEKPASEKPASEKPASEKPERSARAAADPADYSGWLSRGDQLFSRGDHEGASQAYRAAIALRPSGSEANAGLGFALLNSGHARESLPYFDRAASSGYAEANIGLGDAYRKLGQPSSAKEAYQGYLDRLPSGARADYARSALDRLNGGASGDKPATDKPATQPRPPASEYRPAGELIEPSAPPTTVPTAPSETSP